MPTWLKIVLGILIGFVVICSGTMGACYFYGKSKMEEFTDGAAKAKEFGQSHNKKECYDEAIVHAQKCGKTEIMCLANLQVFISECTKVAAESPDLCAGFDNAKTEAWVDEKCAAYKMRKDDRCKTVLSNLVITCTNMGSPTDGTGTDTGTGTGTEDAPMPDEAPPTE